MGIMLDRRETMIVVSVNVGVARPLRLGGREVLSAIGKQPVPGPVAVRRLGLAGDAQADPAVHGGLSKAIYAYPSEHFAFWRTVRAQARAAGWDDPVPHGLLGENLTLAGLTEDRLWIGDRLHGPGCVLAVAEPRLPCAKLDAALGFAHAARLMAQSGFCGAYLGVIEPGTVAAGERFMLEPGAREVNLRDLFRARARGRTA
jgi:MOSC domain-containing protein YiiM